MAEKYSLVGLIALEPGAWADWFAGASSFAAVVVALSAYWWGERTRRREEHERELAAARLIGWKLVRLLNVSHDYYRHFWMKPIDGLVGITGQVEKWRSTYPLVGIQLDSSIALSASEEGLLLKAKAGDLLMAFTLAVGRYSSIVGSVTAYQAKYEALHALMPPPVQVQGRSVTHEMTKEQVLLLQPYSLQLESLIDGIRELTLANVRSCLEMQKQHEEFCQSYFGKVLFRFEPAEELADLSKLGVERPRDELSPS